MCEGLELLWDYVLLMILIYMAYDIFYIKEISPIPPQYHIHPFESQERVSQGCFRM